MSTRKSSRSDGRAAAPAMSLPLFDENSAIDQLPGALNDDSLVRGLITDAIKHCGKSREEIAETMERLLAIPVTARMIGSFTAGSKELHRWPGAWDRAFCIATGDNRLLFCRAELAGYKVISAAEADLLDLGREYLRQKRAAAQVDLLEKRLAGVELL